MRRAAALLPLLLAAGCSVVFVKGPPDPPEPSEEPRCTTSKVLPVLDAIGGTALGIAALVALSGESLAPSFGPSKQEENAEKHRPYAIALGAASLALFGSAIAGFMRTARCDEAHDLHEAFKTY